MFDLFGEEDLFDHGFIDTAKQMKHGVKLMFIRKKAEDHPWEKPLEDDEEVDHDTLKYRNGLPYDIYGNGGGLENTNKLMFWVKSDNEDKGRDEDWEEIQSEKKQEDQNDSDDAEDEEIEDEDLFQEFLEKNTKEAKSGKITCKFCDKKFSYEGITKHFIKTHEKEYEATEFSKEVKWKEAIEINKRLEKKMEDQFMKMTMGGFGFDMDDEEEDFDFDSMFKGKKGKSKGKGKDNFGMEEMLMEMMMGGKPGMAGMPGMGGSKSNSNKRKKNR